MIFSQSVFFYLFRYKKRSWREFCFQILAVSIVFFMINEEELQMSGSRWAALYFLFVCPFFWIHMSSVGFQFVLVLMRTRLTRRLIRSLLHISFSSNHIIQHSTLRLNFNKSQQINFSSFFSLTKKTTL